MQAQRLEKSFKDLLDDYGETEILLKEMPEKLMRDTTKDDESRLSGIYPPEFEYQLSSIFVDCETPSVSGHDRSFLCYVVSSRLYSVCGLLCSPEIS